jgi:hypothetical protein
VLNGAPILNDTPLLNEAPLLKGAQLFKQAQILNGAQLLNRAQLLNGAQILTRAQLLNGAQLLKGGGLWEITNQFYEYKNNRNSPQIDIDVPLNSIYHFSIFWEFVCQDSNSNIFESMLWDTKYENLVDIFKTKFGL